MSDRPSSYSELSRLRPLNMYGYSKHLFDLHAARTSLLDRIVGLKYFNVFGPNEAHKEGMRSLVAKAFPEARDGGAVRLFRSHHPEYGDGEQRRDFLYVKDAVSMTLHLAAHPHATGLYNLGSGTASSWLDLASALFAALGRAPKIDFVEMPEPLRAKYQYYTRADISKLRESGYSESVRPLDEAVHDYVRSYLLPDRRLGW